MPQGVFSEPEGRRRRAGKPESHDVSADVVVSARRLTEIARSLGLTGTVRVGLACLTDALSAIDDPVVRFDLLGPGQRALLTGLPTAVAEPDQAHRHLLMSVKPLL
ncbi:hypothetical protein [Streptomyces sp. NPDC090053]|uniref:hypothetical protein n=1 Tax=Streptomyces sp. NPDC090053 TaxID=3365932 RepID=UPI003827CED4